MRIRKSIVFWVAAVLFLGGLAVQYLFLEPIFVPKDFSDARQRGTDIAQTIVRLTSDSLVDLSRISQAEKNEDFQQIIDLVAKALTNNAQARAEAVRLSATLEVMAKTMPQISPWRARDLATEALSYEVSLINHLITYNDYLNQLLQLLQKNFNAGQNGSHDAIVDWLNRINEEGEAINTLNKKFNDTMVKFDKITSKS